MRIISDSTVRAWAKEHPSAASSLRTWLTVAERAHWTSLAHVREVFPHADAVTVASGKVVTVFNIAGNKYRLITAIKYQWQVVYTLKFLTHAEYSKDRWKDEL